MRAFAFALSLISSLSGVAWGQGHPLWWSQDTSCSGACCLKGSTEDGKECVVLGEVQLYMPKDDFTAPAHLITKRVPGTLPFTTQWGMADEKGRTLIKPRPGYMLPISKGVAIYAQDIGKDYSIVDEDGERKTGWLSVDTAWLWMPQHFAVLKQHPDGRRDEAPIRRDGSLGPTLVGIVPWGIQPIGPNALVVMEAEPGAPRTSALVNVKGEVVWAGQEVVLFGMPDLLSDRCRQNEPAVQYRVAMIQLGPSPLPVQTKLPYLYAPIDERGAPLKLPHGVIGFVPLDFRRPVRAQSILDDVWSWVIVSKDSAGKLEYRVGGSGDGPLSSPAELLKMWDLLAPLDAVRFAKSGHPSGYFASGDGVLVARRVTQKDWVVRGARNDCEAWGDRELVRPRNPQILRNDGQVEGVGKTPEAAAWDAAARLQVTIDAMDGKIVAAERAREEARRREPGQRRANLEVWFDLNRRECTMTINTPASICSQLEAAAIELGSPRLEQWFSSHDRIYAADHSLPAKDRVCGTHARACQLLEARHAALAFQAKEERKKQEIRDLYWQRAAVGYLKGTGRKIVVTWEVDGKMVTEELFVEEFDRRMKERMSK